MAEPVLGESVRGLLRGILMDLRTLIQEEIALARFGIAGFEGVVEAPFVSLSPTLSHAKNLAGARGRGSERCRRFRSWNHR